MSRRFFLAFLAALLLTISPAWAQETLDLTILHTNDLHGHVLPFAYTEPERSKNEQPSVGGAARRATLIRDIKSKTRNPVLVIDSGDTTTRGPLWNAYEGLADIEAMNAVGYDFACLGNNEFKFKDGVEINDAPGAQAALLLFLKHSRFPWIGANVKNERGAFLDGVQPYVVREFNGVRVGFLGLTAPRSGTYPQTKGWTFSDPNATAREWIPQMRRHCDLVVVVSHIGVDLDQSLANAVPGIDAIVGGDSHTFLYKALEVNGVPIVQTGEFGVNLGKFDLHFQKLGSRWKLARYDYALLPVGPKIKEDKAVKAVADRYAQPLQNDVVATLPPSAIGKTPEERNRKTTEVIAFALKQATGADIGLHVQGDGLFEVFRSPNLTRFQLLAVMPFRNHAATVSLTGAQIMEMQTKVKNIVLFPNAALEPGRTYQVGLVNFTATATLGLPPETVSDTGMDVRDAIIRGLNGGGGAKVGGLAAGR